MFKNTLLKSSLCLQLAFVQHMLNPTVANANKNIRSPKVTNPNQAANQRNKSGRWKNQHGWGLKKYSRRFHKTTTVASFNDGHYYRVERDHKRGTDTRETRWKFGGNEVTHHSTYDSKTGKQLGWEKTFGKPFDLKRTIEPGHNPCLLYTSPSPRDATLSRMPSSA